MSILREFEDVIRNRNPFQKNQQDLEEALENYKSMVKTGVMTPRGNQLIPLSERYRIPQDSNYVR